jgi:lysophospholipid acyltransferase (LPLAT)-like uncharacterized protein
MAFSKRIKFFLLRKTAKLIIHSTLMTCRKEEICHPSSETIQKEVKNIIYIFWHRHIFYNIFKFRNSSARPLISFSPDGEIVSEIACEFGMDPIRGSSSKGGAKAFLSMIHAIKDRGSVIMITADGPRGPVREIKDGTIHIAKLTGAAIIPVSWYASRRKVFENSWDKFMIPAPFSRIIFEYGAPVYIPAGLDKSGYKKYKSILKSRLDNLEEEIRLKLKK